MNIQEPQPDLVEQNVKPSFKLSPVARRHFTKTLKALEDAKITTYIDIDALSAYCEAFATYVEATAQLRREGLMAETLNGTPMKHPMTLIADKAVAVMLKYQVEFGMTPSSRTRIHATGAKDKPSNPFDKFAAKSKKPA